MKLKKSYKGIGLLCLLLIVFIAGICFLPEEIVTAGLITRIIDIFCALWIALLTFVIYKTEYVYWYNGITYEDAVKAGSERRKMYAFEHFKRFGGFAAAFTLFSVIAGYFCVPFWVDMIVLFVGEVYIALSSMRIKL